MEGFDEFDNDLVTNEVLSLEVLIDDHNATRERENEAESSVTIQPKIRDVMDALKTVRTYFCCSTEVQDKTFDLINQLETDVFKKTLLP